MFAIEIVLLCLAIAAASVAVPIEDDSATTYKTKCYGELGCFSTGGPFFHPTKRPLDVLPDEREVVNVKYYLYTKENPTKQDNLAWNFKEDDLRKTHFKAHRQTKFITHGFIDTQFLGPWMKQMKDDFIKEGDYNVFIVDWAGGNGLPYTKATANTRLVGAEVALLITKLQKVFGISPMSCHALGHSLGGQIVGYIGERLNKLGRITAFDPAEPYFEGLPKEVRVDPTDADFVEVIHSDAANLIPNIGLGMFQPAGHVDFYPNGGKLQPGCSVGDRFISIVTEGLIQGTRKIIACQHQRAVDLYHDSIMRKTPPLAYACADYDQFLQGKCTSCGSDGSKCAFFGHQAIQHRPHKDDNRLAKFFMVTGGKSPFFLNHYSVVIQMPPSSQTSKIEGQYEVKVSGDKATSVFKLGDGKQELHPDKAHTFLVTGVEDIGNIKGVTLTYKSSKLILKPDLRIKHLEVYPMTAILKDSQKPQATKRFCFTDPIKSGTSAALRAC